MARKKTTEDEGVEDAFIGVDAEYRNYGLDVNKPFHSEDEEQAAAERQFVEWEKSKNKTVANAPNPGEKATVESSSEVTESEEPSNEDAPLS